MKPPVREVLPFIPRCIFNETNFMVAQNYFNRWKGRRGPEIRCSDYVCIEFKLPNIDYPFAMNFCKLCYFTEIINEFEMKEIYSLQFPHTHTRTVLNCCNCGKSFPTKRCIDDISISEEENNTDLKLIVVAADLSPFAPDRAQDFLTHYLDVTPDSFIYEL